MEVTRPRLEGSNEPWPVPEAELERARRFLQDLAASDGKVLLAPDKDADGLSAGVILFRTLVTLGVQESRIHVHLMQKTTHVNSSIEREKMTAILGDKGERWIIAVDQGSRHGPPLVEGAEKGYDSSDVDAVRSMVLDHHFLAPTERGPAGALMVNASACEPVATSALLTWVICRPLWTASRENGGGGRSDALARDAIDYLCLLGTFGDLGVSVKWEPPWPAMEDEIKRWSKKRLGTVVALINAPRRTPQFDVITAWEALLQSASPLDVVRNEGHGLRLIEARESVGEETERCTHTPPRFSKDGRLALLTINSGYQVHPSIATRWAGTLRGAKKLQVVMCSNSGYGLPGMVHFSCRIAGAAKARGEDPNIIDLLREYATMDASFLPDLAQTPTGADSFARGHRQASGGIIPTAFFERLCDLMEIGVKEASSSTARAIDGSTPKAKAKVGSLQAAGSRQKNKITSYFTISDQSPRKKARLG